MANTRETRRWPGLALLLLLAAIAKGVAADAYDPLVLPAAEPPPALDLAVNDAARSREIPLRIYLPPGEAPAPVVLFSHGLGGSREGNAFLGRHWAARGYVVVFVQHPGSDVSVWQDKLPGERLAAMHRAASAENFLLRARDIPAVLDQLERWNAAKGHALAGRLDISRVGMAGHSFGAITTQAVSGQRAAAGLVSFTEPRIKAAIAMSPSSPRRGNPQQALGGVKIPWMLMTGTHDLALLGGADLESRLAVFPALPPGDKYELVLHQAEHSAFTDRALPGDTQPRNPNHHRVILALSTAFWDAHLRGSAAAKEWLDGDAPRRVMERADRWQKK